MDLHFWWYQGLPLGRPALAVSSAHSVTTPFGGRSSEVHSAIRIRCAMLVDVDRHTRFHCRLIRNYC